MNDPTRRLLFRGGALAAVAVVAAVAGWAMAWRKVEGRAQAEARRDATFAEQFRQDASPAPGRAIYVSAAELNANPEKYNERRVILSGVWTTGFELSEIYLENPAQDFSIWVDPDWASVKEPMGDFSNRHDDEKAVSPGPHGHFVSRIVAEGTFRFRRRNPSHPLNGFGHLGGSEGLFRFDRLFKFEYMNSEEPTHPPTPPAPPSRNHP